MPTPLNWQKSSFSGGGEGNACIEVAASDQGFHLRESDEPLITLALTPAGLERLIHVAKTGGFEDRRETVRAYPGWECGAGICPGRGGQGRGAPLLRDNSARSAPDG